MTCTASASCETVRFFFPRGGHLRQKEGVVDRRQNKVPSQPSIGAKLGMIEPQLAFTILKTPLDAPARKGHFQTRWRTHRTRRVGEKIVHLIGAHITCHQQRLLIVGPGLGLLDELYPTTCPHLRAFVSLVARKARFPAAA